MCLTRVGKVIALDGTTATVKFLDTARISQVDVSMVGAKKGSHVEVFASTAIGLLTKREAELKRSLRVELLRRAGR